MSGVLTGAGGFALRTFREEGCGARDLRRSELATMESRNGKATAEGQ